MIAAGDVVAFEELPALERHLPPAVWAWRDRFFHEAMRLEVGPCFRSYAPPPFVDAATQQHAGRASTGSLTKSR